MFQQNYLQNSFLTKTCRGLPRNSVHGTMNEVFFRHYKASHFYRGIDTVQYYRDHEDFVSVGYGKLGLEDLVSIFYSLDLK